MLSKRSEFEFALESVWFQNITRVHAEMLKKPEPKKTDITTGSNNLAIGYSTFNQNIAIGSLDLSPSPVRQMQQRAANAATCCSAPIV